MGFSLYGLSYVGGGQWFVFNRIFPALLPGMAKRSPMSVVGAVALDSFVHMPFVSLPIFYCMQQAVNCKEDWVGAIQAGLHVHRQNLLEDVTIQAAVFGPVQLLNFRYNPPHLRVPTVVTAGVLWICILSSLRGSNASKESSECETGSM